MSLIVAVKAASGLVLASDSRTVFRHHGPDDPFYAVRDDKLKIHSLPVPHQHVALACCGYVPPSLVEGLVARLPGRRLPVAEYAELASTIAREVCATEQARTQPDFGLTVLVAGHDEDATARVFAVRAPEEPEPVEQHPSRLGITWAGAREVVDRLLQGYDSQFLPGGTLTHLADDQTLAEAMNLAMWVPLDRMPLARCVELATFLIRTTIEAQHFQIGGAQLVGGPVDALTITPAEGVRFVRRKPARPAMDETADLPAWKWRCVTKSELVVTTHMPADIRRVGSYTT